MFENPDPEAIEYQRRAIQLRFTNLASDDLTDARKKELPNATARAEETLTEAVSKNRKLFKLIVGGKP